MHVQVGRFFNHSCEPNLKVIKVNCGRDYSLIAFFAKESVEPNEELTWDYDRGVSENEWCYMP